MDNLKDTLLQQVLGLVAEEQQNSEINTNQDFIKPLLKGAEVTFIGSTDHPDTIRLFTDTLSSLYRKKGTIAAINIFPSFIDTVGLSLPAEAISVCAMVGGYPFSYTYPEVKLLECAMAIENGVDEIMMCLNMGEILHKDGEATIGQVAMIKEEIDSEAILKVAIAAGCVDDLQLLASVYRDTMNAGADIIVLSEADITMREIILLELLIVEHHRQTGRRVGISIATPQGWSQIKQYILISQKLLPKEWIDSGLVRADITPYLPVIESIG